MKRFVLSRWSDFRILPSVHVCAQLGTDDTYHERGAIVLNWLYWSLAYQLVDAY